MLPYKRTHIGAMRVSKATWYAQGGFTNSRCFRRQRKNGGWEYYINVEKWID